MEKSIDARVVAALDPIAPTWAAVKESSARNRAEEPDIYFTYQYTTHGGAYADDEPSAEIAYITAILHAPLAAKITGYVRRAKASIHKAGFTWPNKVDASDDKERRIVLEFQDAIGVDFDGEI